MASAVSFDWHDSSRRILKPVAQHSYIEISMTESGVSVIQESVKDENIPALCERSTASKGVAAWKFCLLISAHSGYLSDLPYSMESVKALQNHWRLCAACFILPDIPVATRYQLKDGGELIDCFRFNSPAIRIFNLAISHSRNARETFAVLHSSDKALLDNIRVALMAMAVYAYQPQLLSFIVTSNYLQAVESFVHHGKPAEDWRDIKRHLGCDVYYVTDVRPRVPDITGMPRTFTSLSTVTAGLEYTPKIVRQQIGILGQMLDDFPDPASDNTGVQIRHRLQLMRSRCETLDAKIQAMRESVQSMVQLVYATLQQRDNDLNRRYAADMRVITAITLVFLPGTFVATLFSASFWNFDPRSSGPLVSKWVWLYFLVTIALTLIVLGVWRGYTVLKQFIKAVKNVWRTSRLLEKQDDEEAGKKGS